MNDNINDHQKKGNWNMRNYEVLCKSFNWENEKKNLSGLPDGKGINIAYEAIDRHAESKLQNITAIRWIKKNRQSINFSYLELKKLSARFANVLEQLEIKQGDVIFTLLGRVPELYITALGTLKKKAIFCPIFSVFGPEPVYQRVARGKGKLLVTNTLLFKKKVAPLLDMNTDLKYILLIDSDEHLSENILSYRKLIKIAAEEYVIPETSEETPALLHFTSGTTGMPKGALHVHAAVLTHELTGRYVLDFKLGDIFWCTADPGWVTGTSYGIIAPLVAGVTSVFDEEEFDALRWYSILEEHKVTVWYTAPTAIRRLMRLGQEVDRKFNFTHLRLILSVGEPLHAEAVLWGEKTFGVPVLDNWWQTETGGIMISNFGSMKRKRGSMGKPIPGIQAAIAELTNGEMNLIEETGKAGHLVLNKHFPSIFRTYLNEAERYKKCFRKDWYLTGDLAKKDEDGYFWFVGRADDIIKTSGHMVGPFEVESTLMKHPAVLEAAVIGLPDKEIGEKVKAIVVLKSETDDREELKSVLIGYCRKILGAAVAPKEISFTENLPKTKSGKILRRLLKSRELGLPDGDLSTLEQN
jgi:acetyl-CoA synthetase